VLEAGESSLYASDRLGRSIKLSTTGCDKGWEGTGLISVKSSCCEAKTGTKDGDGDPHDGLRAAVPSKACIDTNCGCGSAIWSQIC
jgi:hypothetical protein